MFLLNRNELLERLTNHVVEINFTKVSGELRKMRCTLRPDLLPPQIDIEESIQTSDTNLESGRMNVWDVEASDWRSFRIESLLSVLTPAP